MAASDTHVAYLLNTMHHKMDSMVHSHHKSVWSPIIGEQLILEKSLPANLYNTIAVVVIKDSQVRSVLYSVIKLFMGHMVFITQRGSVTCKINGRRRNKKA